MFIGEAPSRLGADRTAIPFHGDRAGDNFEHLLELGGLSRGQVFVTNAVLCNPRDASGNNAPPSKAVLRNCAANLQRQIFAIDPRVVVTLGSAALEATRLIEEHTLSLRGEVRTAHHWNGRTLIPLYHPGARAMVHRNFAAQTADYYFVGEIYRRGPRPSRKQKEIAKPHSIGWDVVKFLVSTFERCSLFRLHKAMYLVEWRTLSETGERATDFVYLRQKDGPYCVELGSRWFRRFESELIARRQGDQILIESKGRGLFELPVAPLPQRLREIAQTVAGELAPLSDAQLKTKSYLTKPMKDRLLAERAGFSQLNRPLF